MNKRQAKKAFKKKYGVNPSQYNWTMDETTRKLAEIINNTDWQALGQQIAENLAKAIKELTEMLAIGIRNIQEMIQSPEFQEALRKYKEQEEKHETEKISDKLCSDKRTEESIGEE